MRLVPLIKGLITFLPGMQNFRAAGTGGTDSARYCYSVWLRHLLGVRHCDLDTCPTTVAELGPGDSIGMGLAALLTGAERYLAFDVVEHTDLDANLRIFEQLVELFRNRTPIPDDTEFPQVFPNLRHAVFPADLLSEKRLQTSLAEERLEKIRASIRNPGGDGSMIVYKVPWNDASLIEAGTVDMVFSQAVLEHVDDLDFTYETMTVWLKEGGVTSHTVDFRSHHMTAAWNGHWACPDWLWNLVRGRRPFLINREPYSVHLRLLEKNHLERAHEELMIKPSEIETPSARFVDLSESDLGTALAFFVALKSA